MVLRRVRDDYMAEGGPGDATRFVATINTNGTWDDVDYADRGIGDWRPMPHLVRLRRIARSLAQPGQAPPAMQTGTDALNRGLRAWLQRKPMSDNWWHNTIGQQREIGRVIVLGRALLDEDIAVQAITLLQDPGMVPPAQATGQNLTWYATQQVLRGALRNDAGDLVRASAALASTLRITLDEGIQPDFSFHQHGAQLYTGGYGLGFLQDNVQLAAWLAGTPWALSGSGLDLLANYALRGMVPLLRGTQWLEWGARGREFTRKEDLPRPGLVANAMVRLAPLVPRRSTDLSAAAARTKVGGPPPATTNQLFWRSDFMVHQTRSVYMSVKMCSARTVGTESGNGENLQGFWLPFGVTYLLRRGDEYDGLPPVWNWSALPGLTAPDAVPPLKGYQTHQAQFVGGVSDGATGVATMALDKLQTTGRLSWFFMGDTMVAMGAGIRSTHDHPIATTLNQCRWTGLVHTSAGPLPERGDRTSTAGARWLWHDGLMYLPLDGPDLLVQREHRTQSSSAINSALGATNANAKVLTIAMQHGLRPAGAKFAYAVSTPTAMPVSATVDLKLQILSNSESLQALRWLTTSQIMAVFHAKGSLLIREGLTLDVDSPCICLITAQAGEFAIGVGDPTRRLGQIGLNLRNNAGKSPSIKLTLGSTTPIPYQDTWVGQL